VAKPSSQKFIARNRAPRVQIEYDVEIYGSERKIQLPFVMGVIADLAGKQIDPMPDLGEREFMAVDIDNFDERMKSIKPRVAFQVPNTLTGDGQMNVDITFDSMDDFSPARIARQVGALQQLLEARTELSNLLSYMDGKNGAEQIPLLDRIGEGRRFDGAHGFLAPCAPVEVGDFVLRRADGIISYQLAVVVDDAAQGVTDVVRGADLLDSTARQIHLQRLLGVATPRYLHVPVATNAAGEKLSKQTHATDARPENIPQALEFLGLPAPAGAVGTELLDWAVRHWDPARVPRARSLTLSSGERSP